MAWSKVRAIIDLSERVKDGRLQINKLTKFAYLMLTTALPSFAADDKSCEELEKLGIVGGSIGDHAKEIRGDFYCPSITEVEADIDGDGTEDLVVSYSIEGSCYDKKDLPPGNCGNYHEEFIAVSLKKDGKNLKPAIAKIGGRGERKHSCFTVQGNKIILETLEYRKEDPMCCPSKEGTATC